MAQPWSPHHRRLHQLLLRRPALLPQGSRLLLAVSGGQDSMAMLALLRDLQRLHRWTLVLWHGDHGWRPDSSQQAQELMAWAEASGLTILIDRWCEPQRREEAARNWRYGCLEQRARQAEASHVLTGHTATDRAETVLLHLARGSHRRGLASLSISRELAPGVQLVRPLLGFSRHDTGRICSDLGLPLWLDPSNLNGAFSRNRIRQEVLPVLNALHPGAERRISQLADRLEQESIGRNQLLGLALRGLQAPSEASPQEASPPAALPRRALTALQPANQRQLLQLWLEHQHQNGLESEQLEALLPRLQLARGPGQLPLRQGCTLHWNQEQLWLRRSVAEQTPGDSPPSGSRRKIGAEQPPAEPPPSP